MSSPLDVSGLLKMEDLGSLNKMVVNIEIYIGGQKETNIFFIKKGQICYNVGI